MIEHLRALVTVATDGDRAALRRLSLRILASVATDFLIIYSLLVGLARLRAGESSGQQLFLFLVGVNAFCVFTLSINRELNLRFSNAARDSINRITRRLPRLPLLDYERLDRGTLMTRILGDGNQVASSRQAVFGVLNGGLRLLLGGVFAISVSPESSVVAFVGLLLIGAVTASQMLLLRDGFGQVAHEDARMYGLLRSQIEGGVALAVHRPRAADLGAAFQAISEHVRALRVAMFTAFYDRQFAGDALVYGLLGLNVFIMPLIVGVSSEDVRELNVVILWLVLAAMKLVLGLPRIASAGAALARLQDLEAKLADEHIEPAVREADLDGGPFARFERIEVEDLQFRYPSTSDRPMFPLGPLNLGLRRGELVFITGHNGGGKSTFARLFAGLYRPTRGRIVVDGTAVTDASLAAWRALFGTIFIEHCLFERTHGLDADADLRAPALLEELGIAHKTSIVGGRITNRALSTGQRKRLAMALTRLSNKPIVVLDEWAADQDPEFRELFYDQLLPALRDEGRLVIVVTHDDNYFDRADRCLRFEHGHLVEDRP